MSECPFNKVTRESFVAFTLWGPCAKETIPAVDGDYPSPSLRKSRKLKVWYRNVKHYRGGRGPEFSWLSLQHSVIQIRVSHLGLSIF